MWANKREWGHAQQRSAGGKGVRMRTQFGGAPPTSSGAWGMGVAPCARRKQGAETGGGVYKVEEVQQ